MWGEALERAREVVWRWRVWGHASHESHKDLIKLKSQRAPRRARGVRVAGMGDASQESHKDLTKLTSHRPSSAGEVWKRCGGGLVRAEEEV